MKLALPKWLRLLSRLNIILVTLLMMPVALCAQNYSVADFKVALVGQFIKNISWPDEGSSSLFTIVVAEDQAMMTTLSVLEGETINNKAISVKFASSLTNLPSADLVYISKSVAGNRENALALMRGNGTLVVTENSPTLHNIMVNIVESSVTQNDKVQLSFQLNRPNIVFEGLEIQPELILHGGSELDIATLYRETEQAMQTLRGENLRALKELEQKRQELNDKRAELTAQQQNVQAMELNLEQLQQQLNQSQSALEQQQQQLLSATEKLSKVNDNYLKAREESKNQLAAAQANVNEQLKILSDLETDIAAKNQLISEKELTLQQQTEALQVTSEKLQQKTVEVEQQAQVIDKQFIIIISTIATLLVFSISTVIISKMFLKNKKITKELKTTLETLASAQEQLIESEKLASLGQMVAGVAHEINTPIGVVVTSSSSTSMWAQDCLKQLHNKSLKKSDMEKFLGNLIETDRLIQSNLDRCASLINNFKQVSADQIVAENRTIQLNDYINEIMGALSVVLRRNNIDWQVTGDNPSHYLDPGLLGQVINNLVTNAISHAFTGVEHRVITITIKEQSRYNHIDFSDNGIGMDADTKKKIFDPFFTTKRGEGGTGLGMNIVYNLINAKLHGTITIHSKPNNGTTIAINLPKSD